MLKNNEVEYGSVAKFFHWTIGPAMMIMLVVGYFMTGRKIVNIHQLIGLTILALAIFRLIWTLMGSHPKLPEGMPMHERLLAKTVQVMLYVCMFGMPLTGWAMATAFNLIPHIGNITMPMPGIEINQAFGSKMLELHLILAFGLVGFIGLHLIGALKHHFFEKDNVLRSMLPFSKIEK